MRRKNKLNANERLERTLAVLVHSIKNSLTLHIGGYYSGAVILVWAPASRLRDVMLVNARGEDVRAD